MRGTKPGEVVLILAKPVTSTEKPRPAWMMLMQRLVGGPVFHLHRGNQSRPGREQTYHGHLSLVGPRGGGEITDHLVM